MSIDVVRITGAVTREISSREYEGSPARVLVVSRVCDAEQDDLWDALTNPERISRWFLPISGDLRPGAVGIGWDQALLGLDQHLVTDATVDSTSAMAWLASNEGKSFVRLSSDAWAEASIQSGTEPVAARDAAERVRAMYSGE